MSKIHIGYSTYIEIVKAGEGSATTDLYWLVKTNQIPAMATSTNPKGRFTNRIGPFSKVSFIGLCLEIGEEGTALGLGHCRHCLFMEYKGHAINCPREEGL